ncbi:hypothetical protein RHECNPAF_9300143 [Rhizobium etli CNPAF512]|nr:hypothetical protein RHECNPAF_9300143 [Rhizobium etli CNPAF512]
MRAKRRQATRLPIRFGRHIPSRPVRSSVRSCLLLQVRPGEDGDPQAVEQGVHDHGKQRDPDDIGKDDIHREIAADEEDAVAEAGIRRDCFGGDQEQPGGTELQPKAGDQPRQDLRQHDAQPDLPGGAAERFSLDDLFAGQLQRLQCQVPDHRRRNADNDEGDLRGFAEPHDNEEDRQKRERRHHGDHGDERSEQRAEIRQHADQHADEKRDRRRDAEAGEQPDEARSGIRPEQIFARALVGNESKTVDRIGEAREARQKLVIGVFCQSRSRAESIGKGEQHEGQQRQGKLRAPAWPGVDPTHGNCSAGRERRRGRTAPLL